MHTRKCELLVFGLLIILTNIATYAVTQTVVAGNVDHEKQRIAFSSFREEFKLNALRAMRDRAYNKRAVDEALAKDRARRLGPGRDRVTSP